MSIAVLTYRLDVMGEGDVMSAALQLSIQINYVH